MFHLINLAYVSKVFKLKDCLTENLTVSRATETLAGKASMQSLKDIYRKVEMDTITLNPTQYLMLVIACYCAGWLSYWIADIVKKKLSKYFYVSP